MKTQTSVIALMGPTAVGKTAMAIQLASQFPLDIINVDSMMVYRGLNIGTAKPTPSEQKKAPHRLIDLCNPWESYSVSQFYTDACLAIKDTLSNHRLPFLVGGSMMYFNRLIHGLHPLPKANASIRKELQQTIAQHGCLHLHNMLTTIDPITAKRLHPNDKQRVMRALEVYKASQRPLSQWLKDNQPTCPPFHIISLTPKSCDRNTLRQRITHRLTHMLQNGFIDEVKSFFKHPLMHAEKPSMRAVGYRQVWQYLDGQYPYDQMVQQIITATCQFAKRQITWLRHWNDLHTVSPHAMPAFIQKQCDNLRQKQW